MAVLLFTTTIAEDLVVNITSSKVSLHLKSYSREKINDKEFLLGQYADDAYFLLDGANVLLEAASHNLIPFPIFLDSVILIVTKQKLSGWFREKNMRRRAFAGI